jgi:dTDP-glucose pyrophosphorylase
MAAPDYRKVLLPETAEILEAVGAIDSSSTQIALIVDESGKLLGTVTDGDVRRGLLRGIKLDEPVARVMNRNPTVLHQSEGREEALRTMQRLALHQLPIVDETGRVVGLELIDDLLAPEPEEAWVVLMAGGFGKRLLPLTEETPKPLLPIGGKPLIETIVTNFAKQGFRKFFLAVNYKAEQIISHFGNGLDFNVEIKYLHEDQPLGTAGALSLLPERPLSPVIVMNADLLTSIDFRNLLHFHKSHAGVGTIGVREYAFQVPYGVVTLDGHRLTGIAEKPVQTFFVSAGIYVLQPTLLDLIPQRTFYNMPDLFEAASARGQQTLAFPIREYWLDIGRFDDLERARNEFAQAFP